MNKRIIPWSCIATPVACDHARRARTRTLWFPRKKPASKSVCVFVFSGTCVVFCRVVVQHNQKG